MDQELIAYLEERFRENSRQIAGLREETMSRFEQVDEALRENRDEIRRTQEDVRHTQGDVRLIQEEVRHNQIVVEALRSDLQGVAEGVLSTNQRLDAFQDEVRQEFKEVRHSIRLAYTEMDKRVLSLEEWRKRVGEDPAPRVRKKS